VIPILDLQAQYAALEERLDAAIKDVLRSGSFVLGPVVRDLEERLAAYCECRHAIGVASGTDALHLALAALDLGPGDEVITTPFTFIATANTISHRGATPVFVDIDSRTFNLDPTALAAAITPRTRAILPVHLYGQPAEMGPIMELAERHRLRVVEDCAQAIGARYHGHRVGSFGDLACYSFYPTKNLGAYGDGGLVTTDDAALAERVDVLRRHGSPAKYEAELLGFNSRLDALQAAILGVKLDYLDAWNAARRERAAIYDRLLADLPVQSPYVAPGVEHVYHQYTIRAPRRDALAAYLHEQGIATMIYYPIPLHRQPVYASLGLGPGSLPASEAASAEVLSLPMYPELSPAAQHEVAAAIRAFYSS
jgi:dTDP-4-amino-4,6-dideoxygalactose transaminase